MPEHSVSAGTPASRRLFLKKLVGGAVGVVALGAPLAASLSAQSKSGRRATAAPRAMTVYKDPNCGCCKEWVKHVQAAGFTVTVRELPNGPDMTLAKRSFGVPAALESCHTARVGNYTIEGHVPADLIVKLLAENPKARGLAVPGMVTGSPGMEGSRKDPYDVLLFDAAGGSRVYASR